MLFNADTLASFRSLLNALALEESKTGKLVKVLKFIAPHLILASSVIVYLLIGAAIFRAIELDDSTYNRTSLRTAVAALLLQPVDDSNLYAQVKALTADYRHLSRSNRIADRPWSWSSSILHAFSTCTTIGYGNVSFKTTGGQIFAIIYSMLGIPLTMIAIANLGKFSLDVLGTLLSSIWKSIKKLFKRSKSVTPIWHSERSRTPDSIDKNDNNLECEAELTSESTSNDSTDDSDPTESSGGVILSCFVIWLILGAILVPLWETEMGPIEAVYFLTISATSIGYGDIIPNTPEFLPLTMFYLFVGLAITTMAVEVLGNMFHKIHYFGRKISKAGKLKIWVGGKRISIEGLVSELMTQLDVDPSLIEEAMNKMDSLVNDAVDSYTEDPKRYLRAFLDETQSKSHRGVVTPTVLEKTSHISIEYIDGEC